MQIYNVIGLCLPQKIKQSQGQTNTKVLYLFSIFSLFFLSGVIAQKKMLHPKIITLPFCAEVWDTTGTQILFNNYDGQKTVKINESSNRLIAKKTDFSNGTIEFDVQPYDVKGFKPIAIYFRYKDSKQSEYLYFRTKVDDTKRNNDDIQYAPIINGVLMFNAMSAFDGPAAFYNNRWNHVKLVISGMQLRVFVNDMRIPVLDVPYLEAESKSGSIAFEGKAYFANVVTRPGETSGLSSEAGIDYTQHDANYIRNWQITVPQVLAQGKELIVQDLPKNNISWFSIVAERRGMVNVTRKFGSSDTSRFVWLKTIINSIKDQVVQCQFGYTDEVSVFSNNKLIYTGKNQFGLPLAKFPDGCMNIDNSTINIPLKQGKNELIIGLVNNFYSWGIMARLQNLNGIKLMENNSTTK